MSSTGSALRGWWLLGAGVLVVAAPGAGWYAFHSPASVRSPASGGIVRYVGASHGGGIFHPPTVPATEATLADDELVIGVEVNGHTRAYRKAALIPVLDHVVNDVIDGVPVTVTYCNLCDCTRVFTGDGSEPLELVAGEFRDGLLLRVRGRMYRQDNGTAVDQADGEFPYRTYPFELVPWMEWRVENPETDVYLGRSSVAKATNRGAVDAGSGN